jgi:hypothetical protein
MRACYRIAVRAIHSCSSSVNVALLCLVAVTGCTELATGSGTGETMDSSMPSGGTGGDTDMMSGGAGGVAGVMASGGSGGVAGANGGAGGSGGGGGSGGMGESGGMGGSGGMPPELGPLMKSAYLKASNTDGGDVFGFRTAMSADGTTLAITATGEKSSSTMINGDESDNSLSRPGAAYIFVKDGDSWKQEAYLKASNNDDGAAFGGSVSISGDGNTVAIGAEAEQSGSTGINGPGSTEPVVRLAGAAYVFVRSSGAWTQQAYIKPSNTSEQDLFGISLSLSGDGNTLAVGAHQDDSSSAGVDGDDADTGAFGSGAVFLFRRSGTAWRQANYIKASNPEVEDLFGVSVALSADAELIAVGAPNEDSSARSIGGDQADNAAEQSGAVYVFARDGVSWTQQAYLKASNADAGDAFGWSVAFSSDGQALAVAALFEDGGGPGVGADEQDNSTMDSGAVYLFARDGTTWTQDAYVKSSNPGQDDQFGFGIALSGDGTTLAVGANREDSAAKGPDGDQNSNAVMQSGAVYVFQREGAMAFEQESYLKATNTAAAGYFGTSVALKDDGAAMIASGTGDASNATGVDGDEENRDAVAAGAVFVFTRQ